MLISIGGLGQLGTLTCCSGFPWFVKASGKLAKSLLGVRCFMATQSDDVSSFSVRMTENDMLNLVKDSRSSRHAGLV